MITCSGHSLALSESQSPLTVSDQFGTFCISSNTSTKPLLEVSASRRASSQCCVNQSEFRTWGAVVTWPGNGLEETRDVGESGSSTER